jgi:predicted MFS family arabinose efflux permease
MLATTVAAQFAVPTLQRRLGTGRLLVVGLLALGVPAPFYLLSSALPWLVVVSAVRGTGFAVVTVLGALLSARVAPVARRGEAVGIYGLAIAVPNLITVPASTALTSYGHFAWVAVLAASPLLAVPLVRRFAAATAPAEHAPAHSKPHSRERSRAALRAAAPPSLVLLVVTLSGGGLLTFLPIARPDGSVASISLFLFGLTAAASRWRAGSVGDRVGNRKILAAMLVAGAIGLAVVAFGLTHVLADAAARSAVILVGAAVFGVGYGATQNITQVVAFERAGSDQEVTASTAWNAAFDAGTGIGAYGVGVLAATQLGLPGSYLVCVGLIAAVVPVALSTTAHRPRVPAPV